MALNDVKFIKGQGGLGRPLPTKDHISSMIFYTGTLPSGFSSNDRIKQIFSVQDAENLGILNTYADETKATATYLVTNKGADGDTINIKVTEFVSSTNLTGVVDLGTYTKVSADSTTALVATAIAAVINAGTNTHGYTASVNTSTVTITARKGLGIYLNSGSPTTVTIVGTIAGTLTDFSGGVASLQATWHYHISEYFRIQPQGNLYLGFYAVPTTYDFTDLVTVQQYANGEIRQFAVYCDGTTYTSGKVQAAQAVAATLESQHMPASILVTFNYAAATLSTLADLSTLNSNKVSVVIGQDGFNNGFRLYKAVGKSITNLGCVLGAVSLSKVSEDIAWIGKFNLSDGSENDVAAFGNGVLYSAQTSALLSQLNDYRYIFLTKQVGYTGTWVNDSHTCIVQTSDYAYIENNRTIDKAIRLLRAGYLPALASPITLNSDGTLSDVSVAYFEGLGDASLDQMVRDAEISQKSVTVDPTQNVLSSNKLVVSVKIIPVGVARNIVVNIKYVLSL